VRKLAKRGLVSDAVLERYRQKYGSDDYRAASGVIRGILVKMISEDYSEALSDVRCPVELVWGENDTAAPVVVAEKIRAALPSGAHLVVCPGVGHMTPLQAPGDLRAAIERLLP
jgi:pimeloyl-ACP methyl ester carboxylesterase